MAEVLYRESAELRERRNSEVLRRSLRKQAILILLLLAGLSVVAYPAVALEPSPWALVWLAATAPLFVAMILLEILSTRRKTSRLLRGYQIDSGSIVLPALESPLPRAAVEKVYWNPTMPFLVIVTKKAVHHKSPFIIVEKPDLANVQAFRSALERLVPVVDVPEKGLEGVWADLGYPAKAKSSSGRRATRRRVKSP